MMFASSDVSLCNGGVKWEKRKTNEHKEFRRDTPTSGLQPSHGRVPPVLWICPILREAKPGGFQTRVFPTFFGT